MQLLTPVSRAAITESITGDGWEVGEKLQLQQQVVPLEEGKHRREFRDSVLHINLPCLLKRVQNWSL